MRVLIQLVEDWCRGRMKLIRGTLFINSCVALWTFGDILRSWNSFPQVDVNYVWNGLSIYPQCTDANLNREGPNLSFQIGGATKHHKRVTAIADGCFKIDMIHPESKVKPIWPRQKAAILVEVPSPL